MGVTPTAHGEWFSVNAQPITTAVWEKRFGWEAVGTPVNCTYVGSGNLSVAVAGWYVFSWGAGMMGGTNGRRLAGLIFSDGKRYQVEAFTTPSGSANQTRFGASGSCIRYCPAGTQFWVEAYQNSGAAVNWDTGAGTSWVAVASLAGP